MIRNLHLLVIFSAMFGLSVNAAAAPDMKPGNWRMSIQMNMQGMHMPPMTYHRCLTKKDLVPRSSKDAKECKMTENRENGNEVTWKMKCNSRGGSSELNGKVTYSGKKMNGKITIMQGGHKMVQMISGSWKGRCK